MKRKIVSEKHTFSFIFMGALSKLVLITNRLLIMIFETFDALMTNILAIFSPKKRKSMQMSNSNEIGQKTLYQIYAKKNIVFYSAPAKKTNRNRLLVCIFPFSLTWLLMQKQKTNQTQDLSLFYSIILQNRNFLSRLNFINSYWSRV